MSACDENPIKQRGETEEMCAQRLCLERKKRLENAAALAILFTFIARDFHLRRRVDCSHLFCLSKINTLNFNYRGKLSIMPASALSNQKAKHEHKMAQVARERQPITRSLRSYGARKAASALYYTLY